MGNHGTRGVLRSTVWISIRGHSYHLCPHALGIVQCRGRVELLVATDPGSAGRGGLCGDTRACPHRVSSPLEKILAEARNDPARVSGTPQMASRTRTEIIGVSRGEANHPDLTDIWESPTLRQEACLKTHILPRQVFPGLIIHR